MPKPWKQILVCVNERPPDATKPSCGPQGGLAVYRAFKDAVRSRGVRDRVMVTRTGCLKHCSRGIVVAVQPDNRWLAGVTEAEVEAILEHVVLGGEAPEDGPLAPFAMPDVPWE